MSRDDARAVGATLLLAAALVGLTLDYLRLPHRLVSPGYVSWQDTIQHATQACVASYERMGLAKDDAEVIRQCHSFKP